MKPKGGENAQAVPLALVEVSRVQEEEGEVGAERESGARVTWRL